MRVQIIALPLVLAVAACTPSAAAPCHGEHDDRALAADPRTATGPIAPELQGLGEHHHPVTTKSERAQLFFDQGLKLTYGFNHQEALRSFKEAARLDPDCAMAYWGWALVLGPNLNLPMRKEVVAQAFEAIQLAPARRDRASPKERAHIEALAKRYVQDPEADRAPLDAAFAEAMREVHRSYPDDTDAATLFAAALMEKSPWNYWTPDRQPRPETPEILATLEAVIARDAQHEGALHYYIHAVEAVDAERGSAAADALRGLAPGAGHLVHMPSHIYIQLGRYAEAFDDNAQAASADESYIAQCKAQGMYPLTYYPHNVHFQAWAATIQGRTAAALELSRKVASVVPDDFHEDTWALYDSFRSMPLYTMARFGMWDALLAEPQPPEERRFWRGVWHWTRGVAFARTDRLKEAARELAALGRIADEGMAPAPVGFSNSARLLAIARAWLDGEIAAKRGKLDLAIAHAERAVRLEDGLTYTEPPDWYLPTRHLLGALLLEAGRPGEAETVYWQDLRLHRENGWALYGLWQALEAQPGREQDAAAIEARFRAAWADADVKLAASRF